MLAALQPGTLFHGRYRVVSCINKGGMGAVYEVADEKTAAARALKVMLPSLVEDASLRERFAREATVTGGVESDHLVRVLDAGADGDALANPAGNFHPFPITNPLPGTPAFDFNCDGTETEETPKVTCGADCASQGFQGTVACGAAAPLGKCVGVAPMCTFQLLSPAVSKTQRCK
jgi:hypothetical protein